MPEPNVALTFAATLVDEWVRRGLRHAVVCPGSRSTPLAVALARHPALAVHVALDERSGAFRALGVGLAGGVPAVVVTTSGTAAVELHPAVVEAHQAAVPLLAVTADRPPELQGLWAPQTIDQRELFGRAVRWYGEPGPPEPAGAAGWRDLAADAWSRTGGLWPGPVHLNLAFREPLVGEAGDLPPAAAPTAAATPVLRLVDEQLGPLASLVAGRRGLIVAGARATAGAGDVSAVLSLAELLDWPLIADHPSGLRVDHGSVVWAADPLLRVRDDLQPEVVVRLGGLHASRVLNEWLARSGAVQVGIDRYGMVPDPDRLLARSLTADVGEACRQLIQVLAGRPTVAAPAGWRHDWTATGATAADAVQGAMAGLASQGVISEPWLAAAALAAVPPEGMLVASSSMPVRDLEWYVGPGAAEVRANRGANGIDGVASTALGVALTGRPTLCLLGDLAFLHDAGALVGLADAGIDLCLLVVDNDGGGIFSFLPQADQLSADEFELLFGTPHGTDLAGLARAHGVPAVEVADPASLDAALGEWRVRGGPAVVVARSDRVRNRQVHAGINAAVAAALTGG